MVQICKYEKARDEHYEPTMPVPNRRALRAREGHLKLQEASHIGNFCDFGSNLLL